MPSNFIVVLAGPTASYKTYFSIELAKNLSRILKRPCEIVNADSLQFYKELSIGSARPTENEMENIPHHFFGHLSIKDPLNAAHYARDARKFLKKLLEKNILPIVVGGSGLYLKALLYGVAPSPQTPQEIKLKSDALYLKGGITPFLKELESIDLESFKKLHSNDHYRIRRAMEHFWAHGTPFSKVLQSYEEKKSLDPFDPLFSYLKIPPEDHWPLIYQRTQKMFEMGLLDEIKGILKDPSITGYERPLTSIGYQEGLDYLVRNKIKTLEECKERVYIKTRQLAKAQRTWFNKFRVPHFFEINPQIGEISKNLENLTDRITMKMESEHHGRGN